MLLLLLLMEEIRYTVRAKGHATMFTMVIVGGCCSWAGSFDVLSHQASRAKTHPSNHKALVFPYNTHQHPHVPATDSWFRHLGPFMYPQRSNSTDLQTPGRQVDQQVNMLRWPQCDFRFLHLPCRFRASLPSEQLRETELVEMKLQRTLKEWVHRNTSQGKKKSVRSDPASLNVIPVRPYQSGNRQCLRHVFAGGECFIMPFDSTPRNPCCFDNANFTSNIKQLSYSFICNTRVDYIIKYSQTYIIIFWSMIVRDQGLEKGAPQKRDLWNLSKRFVLSSPLSRSVIQDTTVCRTLHNHATHT